MSSTPDVSQYQAAAEEQVFQPTLYSSDSDLSDEKKAAAQYDADYGGTYTLDSGSAPKQTTPAAETMPTLSMSYTTAPDLIPQPSTNTSSGSGQPAPATPSMPIYVQLGEMLAAEQIFLTSTSAIQEAYENTLLPAVQNALSSNSLFGQMVGSKQYNPDTKKNSELGIVGWQVTFDKLDSEGTSFAESINPNATKLLKSVGDTIEALGAFCAMLNNAAQYYADTDFQSVFPPPALMEGPNPSDDLPSTS